MCAINSVLRAAETRHVLGQRMIDESEGDREHCMNSTVATGQQGNRYSNRNSFVSSLLVIEGDCGACSSWVSCKSGQILLCMDGRARRWCSLLYPTWALWNELGTTCLHREDSFQGGRTAGITQTGRQLSHSVQKMSINLQLLECTCRSHQTKSLEQMLFMTAPWRMGLVSRFLICLCKKWIPMQNYKMISNF